ncbi:MAG TPA: hypothetical protein VFR18_23035 [Terriglobia bacterium]|nr:hypothetical protein [Terriglobia bacterium]
MPRTIYEKPTRALLKDMVKDLGLKPGQVFTTARAMEWFKQQSEAEARKHPSPLGTSFDERSEQAASSGNERDGRPSVQVGIYRPSVQSIMGATEIRRSMGFWGVLSITWICNVCCALPGSHGIYSALLNSDTGDSGLIPSGNDQYTTELYSLRPWGGLNS